MEIHKLVPSGNSLLSDSPAARLATTDAPNFELKSRTKQSPRYSRTIPNTLIVLLGVSTPWTRSPSSHVAS